MEGFHRLDVRLVAPGTERVVPVRPQRAWEPEEHFHEGALVYLVLRGDDSIGSGLYSPRITWFSATTEAPDETARGAWLELVSSAGLAHAAALLRYLAAGEYEVEREAEAFDDVVTRNLPGEAGAAAFRVGRE